MKSLIIGFGEIGKGLYGAVKDSSIFDTYDTAKSNILPISEYDILHICIPGNIPEFVDTVIMYITTLRPKLATVIHSTVVPGTTKIIGNITNTPVLHCPIRGKHPDMASHIKTYKLHLGCDGVSEGLKIWLYFTENYGLKTKLVDGTKTTELGKILELYRYGLLLMSAYMQTEVCQHYGVDYDGAVLDFIETYNGGLEEVGMCQYKQSRIPAKTDEFIGGHCVIENCHELFKVLPPDVFLKHDLERIVAFGKGERKLK